MNSKDNFLLILFMILTTNNVISIIIYEVTEDKVKVPLVIKGIGYLTAIITLVIGFIFFKELYLYLRESTLMIIQSNHF